MKTWKLYLSGEIHTDWREQIEEGCRAAGLPVALAAPVTHHEASDDCGVSILGEEPNKFWHDHKGAQINAIRTRTPHFRSRYRDCPLWREVQAVERGIRRRLCFRNGKADDRDAPARACARTKGSGCGGPCCCRNCQRNCRNPALCDQLPNWMATPTRHRLRNSHFPIARQPMSRRQKPLSQSISSAAA